MNFELQRGSPYPVKFLSKDQQKCQLCCLSSSLGSNWKLLNFLLGFICEIANRLWNFWMLSLCAAFKLVISSRNTLSPISKLICWFLSLQEGIKLFKTNLLNSTVSEVIHHFNLQSLAEYAGLSFQILDSAGILEWSVIFIFIRPHTLDLWREIAVGFLVYFYFFNIFSILFRKAEANHL